MHTFSVHWNLLNISEKEETFIVDHVISICVVVLFTNVVGSSTMLVFKLISTTASHQPIFMLGSSIFSVTTQAVMNVVMFGSFLLRALSCCLKYSQTISKDTSF